MVLRKRIRDPRERREMSRAVLNGPVARTTLGLVTVVGAGGIMGIFGAGPAAADPVSLTLRYVCSVPAIQDRPVTVLVHSDIPQSVTVGEPTPKYSISAAVPVSAANAAELRRAGIKTIEGTTDVKVRVAAPEGDSNITVPFRVSRTNVPASGGFSVKATGVAPTRTFNQAGRAKITVGDLIAHVTASGFITAKVDVPCRLDAGQNNVVASFDITGKTTTTVPVTPPRTTDTATPGTTRSQNPSEGRGEGTTTEGSTSPSGNLATAGSQSIKSLIPLGTELLSSALVGSR